MVEQFQLLSQNEDQDNATTQANDVDSMTSPNHDVTEQHETRNGGTTSPSVTFSNGFLFDDVLGSRDVMSSPTASRMTLGFGSLDIVMANDKTRSPQHVTKEDGGSVIPEKPQRWGWVVVVASWVVMIPIAGVLASFGNIVSSLTEEFNATKLEAGWIGSLAFSFTVGTCPLSTPLMTVYGARKVGFVGVVGASISVFVTSFTPVLHLMFLTYSAMLGIFANFVYNTAMNLTGQYFPNKHQALATCLASAGVSFGTLLINPLTEYLIRIIGWRHTLKVMSGMIAVVGGVCVATFKPVKTQEQKLQTKIRKAVKQGKEATAEALIEKKVGSLSRVDIEAVTESIQHMHTESRMSLAAQEIKKNVMDKSVWDCSFCSNPAFILWMLGTLFWSISFLFPFIFLIDYMGTIGITGSSSAWVLTAYGIAEFGGRLLCALTAGKIKFSLAYVYAASAAFVGVATILAPQGKTLGVMYAYAISAGINSGILNSLMYVTTMQLFGNEKGRHVWGYINVMLALGMVTGPVAAGGIYDATKSYSTSFYMGGGLFILCSIVMLLIPISLRHFPQNEEPEQQVVKMKPPRPPHPTTGSIVKPGALRRLAQHQAAIKSSKSKWNGEVEEHLQALDEIEEEVNRNSHVTETDQSEGAKDPLV
uniref:Monocarboxylate transporter 5-like n=1 Tax=Ciona intestinalis TaxID=7719 RepID=F6Y782_CIOIN|nr:monocarboxylate transporter 5-like [Ciona intestinalis]|eukprot:XP_002119449.1 monocarboxylate transporter 5-like [Ciona intestinalis]